MNGRIKISGDRHMETLGNCGGYYACPKDANGRRLGPLVGYAGKYKAPNGEMLQFVGDVYANFAKAEKHPHVLRFFARAIIQKLHKFDGFLRIDAFVGAPIGGYSLADTIGLNYPGDNVQVIKAEKKATRLATGELREQSRLVFARHDIEEGFNYVIVEDVCNNFSTTAEMINLIQASGGNVVAIACFLNRSLEVDGMFAPVIGDGLPCWPVISLIRLPIPEYRQDDPAVAEDIVKGNVVLKPKDEWPCLMRAMTDYAPEHGAGE